jgi:hypothetical protein
MPLNQNLPVSEISEARERDFCSCMAFQNQLSKLKPFSLIKAQKIDWVNQKSIVYNAFSTVYFFTEVSAITLSNNCNPDLKSKEASSRITLVTNVCCFNFRKNRPFDPQKTATN